MNKVEYLHMMQKSVKSGERANVSVRDMDIALEEIERLRADIHKLIHRWKHESDYLEEFGSGDVGASHFRQRAADLERMLENQTDVT